MLRIRVGLLFLLALAPSARGQAPQPGDPVPLTLGPAAAPKPSLEYRLLPVRDEQTPGNAATLYYRSLTLFSENKALLDDIKQQHWDDWLEAPLEDLPLQEVRDKLGFARHLLREVELASRCRQCDWQLDHRPEGPGLLLPEVQTYRRIGTLLAVRARYEMAQGRWAQAVGTLGTGLTVARDMGRGPTFIHVLVGMAIANLMGQRLEEFVQQPGAPNLYWALAVLPRPLGDIEAAVEEERTMVERFSPLLARLGEGPLTPGQLQAGLGKLDARLDDLGVRRANRLETLGRAALISRALPEAKRSLEARGFKAEQLDTMPPVQVVALQAYRDYREAYDEAAKWRHVPDGFRHPRFKDAAARLRQATARLDQMFFRGLLRGLGAGEAPAFAKVTAAIGRVDRRLAALGCVEALRLYAAGHAGRWPAALSDITEVPAPPDPLTGKPFEYKLDGARATLAAPLPPGPKPPPYQLLTYALTLRPK
jgi:hypothetical protein